MAIHLKNRYPLHTTAADAEYPFGKARNISSTGAKDGTPWEADLINDLYGFLQALLDDAAVTPSEVPDKVGASQYLDAIKAMVGGGGAIPEPSYKAWGSNPPQTLQLASTVIAADGVAYNAGDVFLSYIKGGSQIYVQPTVALKGFTYSDNYGSRAHQLLGDVFIPYDIVVSLENPGTATVTAADITLVGRTIILNSITLDVNATSPVTSGLVTAGNPVYFPYYMTTGIPWVWATEIAAKDVVTIEDDSGPFLIPAYIFREANISSIYSKTTTEWSNCAGVTLGYSRSSTPGLHLSNIALNGSTITVPEAVQFFITAPNPGDAVYLVQTSPNNDLSVKMFDTTPVDGNTIRIGTWGANNTLTVQIA